MDRRLQAFGGRWSHLQAFGDIRGSSCTRLYLAYVDRRVEAFRGIRRLSFLSRRWLTWIVVHKPLMADGVVYKPLVACVDRRFQAFGGRWSHLQAFDGIRGSSFTSLWWQMESFTSLWWHTWIAVHKPLVADGVVYKPFGANVDYRVQGFDGIRGSSFTNIWWQMEPFTSLWWNTWIVLYKPLVVCVDPRSQALGGRWSHLQAFGGIRGSSCTSLWWHTWIVVCKPLVADGVIYRPFVAYVDRRVHSFDGLRGSSFTSLLWQMESFTNLWWHTWIVLYKPLVAGGVICKPLVAYVDRRSQAFGGRWSHLQAFGGIRGSACTCLWWHTWIVVCKPLVADGVIYKPYVAYMDRCVQGLLLRKWILV